MRPMKLDVPKGQGEKGPSGTMWVWHTGRVVRVGAGWAAACAWLTAKIAPLQWHVEDDFLAEASMLEGHVASSRPTWTRKSRITRSSFFLRLP